MKGRLGFGTLWTIQGTASRSRGVWNHHERRPVTTRSTKRAAVHGTKLPVTETVDKEKVEMVVNKGKIEKEKKRKEVEETVDSQLDNFELLSEDSRAT